MFSATRFTTMLAATCLLALPGVALAQDGHGTRDAVDWEGRYIGDLPCADCPGIETQLTINEAGFYTLKETYLESEDSDFETEGEFEWNADGSQISLKGDDDRIFMIGEGQAWMVGEDGKRDEAYALTKQQEFNGDGAQLYVDPNSVSTDEVDGATHAKFDGLWNFEHEMEGGHKSIRAVMEINCKTHELDMPVVAYFKDIDAGGEMIHETGDNADNWTPIPVSKDDVIRQAAEMYCS